MRFIIGLPVIFVTSLLWGYAVAPNVPLSLLGGIVIGVAGAVVIINLE